MRGFVSAPALFAVSMFAGGLLLADDKPWPQKGDAVYVSVDLPSAPGESRGLPACTAVTLEDRPAAHRLVVVSADREAFVLDGDWSHRLFHSEAECDLGRHTIGVKVERHNGNVFLLTGGTPTDKKPLPRVGDIVYSPVLQTQEGVRTVMGKDRLPHQVEVRLIIPSCTPLLKINTADPQHLRWTFSPKEADMWPDFGWEPPVEWLTLKGNWLTGAPPEMYPDVPTCRVAVARRAGQEPPDQSEADAPAQEPPR